MVQRSSHIAGLEIAVDNGQPEPAYLQIYAQLRSMIMDGRLPGGARLLSSRCQAQRLGRSRNTIAAAYDLLLSEGLIESRQGSGTFIVEKACDATRSFSNLRPLFERETGGFTLSHLSSQAQRLVGPADAGDEPSEAPDPTINPYPVWGRLLRRVWHKPVGRVMAALDPAGYQPLRQQIAAHLAAARAVRCKADDIILTSSVRHGLSLATRLLAEAGDVAVCEDPGEPGVRQLLASLGLSVVGAPADDQGIDIAGAALPSSPRLAVVTPSRQPATGAVMSLERRRELLAWAAANRAWIFEDDTGGELALDEYPISSIQGLDDSNRVIYAGTLNRVLFHGIQLSYLVVPPGLQPFAARLRAALEGAPPLTTQPALALFFEEGYFAAHVNRLRRTYIERRVQLTESLHDTLPGFLDIAAGQGGLDVTARFQADLAGHLDDRAVCEAAGAAGLALYPMSARYYRRPAEQGLIIPLAAMDVARLDRKVSRLQRVIEAQLGFGAAPRAAYH